MNLPLVNIDCMGHNDLCKVVSTPIGVQSKTGDFKEPDYIDADIFTSIVKTGEPKVSAGKELELNYLGEAIQGSIPSILDDMNIDESHGRKIDRELFCVTGKDSDSIDIDDLY